MIEDVSDLCKILLDCVLISCIELPHRQKSVYILSLPDIDPLNSRNVIYLSLFGWKSFIKLGPRFIISVQHKIFIDKMRHTKIQ